MEADGAIASQRLDCGLDAVERRGKYLLFRAGDGTLIVHLGMSGRLWVVDADVAPAKHDHFDLALANGNIVRFRDPRRFGLVLWQRGDPLAHKLLRDIGPEPFSDAFNAAWLHRQTRTRSAAIKIAGKNFVMSAPAIGIQRVNQRYREFSAA